MKPKKWRNFLCGLLLGAGSVYWFAFYSGSTFDTVVSWLETESERYQAENPTPKANSGWRK